MDCFVRLIALFALLVSSNAFAIGSIPPQQTATYECTGYNGQKARSTAGASAACSAVVRPDHGVGASNEYYYRIAHYYVKDCAEDANGPYCNIWVSSTYPNCSSCTDTPVLSVVYRAIVTSSFDCPANSTLAGSSCSCNSGYINNAGNTACQQYTCPPSGSYSAITQPDQKVTNAGEGTCSAGCSYQPSSWKVGQDGQIWATWPFKSTGSFCKGDPSPANPAVDTGEKNTKNPAPVPCGQNQCPGTVNGATICVPCKGTQEQGPSTTASAPGTGASGPSTSTTTTECNGVNCTTTTTTTDGNGGVTGQTQTSQKQESFCKENPQSALCKQSSFGGACAATTCEGDAVMCAIAADQYKRNCEWFDDPAAAQLATVGNAAITGQDRPPGHPANDASSQSVSFSSVIDQSDRLGAGCPTDVAVSVAGKSVSIPFSSMCGNLQLVGNLMVGFCMFVAALIVFRS